MNNNNDNTHHIMKFSLFFKITLFFRDIYFLTPQSNVVFSDNCQSLSICSVPGMCPSKELYKYKYSVLREPTHITGSEKLHIHPAREENVYV